LSLNRARNPKISESKENNFFLEVPTPIIGVVQSHLPQFVTEQRDPVEVPGRQSQLNEDMIEPWAFWPLSEPQPRARRTSERATRGGWDNCTRNVCHYDNGLWARALQTM
jgi:hypothetical protein